jgi:ABC-type multidrug transport system fused ATPase/permease subunit
LSAGHLFGVVAGIKRHASVQERMADPALLGSLKAKTDTRINLEVDQLGLRLNSNKAVVLAGVDGKINAGGVTAIMGPSGAGKTTFLNTLCGRANYGTMTGRLLINGQENAVTSLGRLVGFVPQVHRCASPSNERWLASLSKRAGNLAARWLESIPCDRTAACLYYPGVEII